MRIEVYKDWVIRSDANQFILAQYCGIKKKKEKDGSETEYEYWKNETYHTSIKSTLQSLVRKEILACRATTFEGLKKECDKLNKMIEQIAKEIGA